jgi:DNA-binding winged helix-turn-helix (wHTH) protein
VNDQPIIGDWRFDIASAALTQRGCTKRLEDRSARTLALLCVRRGEVVSKADILEEVWQGRTVSDNSVAIVIADLRRALGESSRAPHHIETIGKRGYRLRAAPDIPVDPETPIGAVCGRRAMWMWSGIAAVAAVLIVILMRATQPTPVIALMLGPVRNDTGEGRYEPLARSLAALVEERAARMPGVVATSASAQPADVRVGRRLEMRSRLIIWNDTPTLSLAAIDRSDGRVVWSGMAIGQPDAIAAATIGQLADFRRHL